MTLADRLDHVGVAGRERHADARLDEVDHRQTDEERGRGHDLEINQRFHAHPSDLSQRARAGDANDDGREDERRDDRLDQVNENVAQKINGVAPIGPQPADHAANDQSDHDLDRERRADTKDGALVEQRFPSRPGD